VLNAQVTDPVCCIPITSRSAEGVHVIEPRSEYFHLVGEFAVNPTRRVAFSARGFLMSAPSALGAGQHGSAPALGVGRIDDSHMEFLPEVRVARLCNFAQSNRKISTASIGIVATWRDCRCEA
jgi:hypothetical protein